ncbi:MAG: hypothetical protein E7425_09600 [Ruminococcaceae bacterium]|nr:hypothetical protein [Oscillospiraceae bacterium]
MCAFRQNRTGGSRNMRHTNNRTLGLLLTLLMLLGLLPWSILPARADQSYGLWVGGTQVTTGNADNITGADTPTASYDAANNTLTLNGCHFSGEASADGWKAAIAWFGEDPLTIELNGMNSVAETVSGGTTVNGIFSNADLNFTGTGSLDVTSGGKTEENAYNYSIYSSGNVTVSGGATLTCTAGDVTGASSECYGIRNVNGSVTVSGEGSSLTATAGKAGITSSGVSCVGDIIVSDGATLSGAAGEATGEGGISWGIISVKGSVTVSGKGSSLTAIGGDAKTATSGVRCYNGNVTVENGATLSGAAGEVTAGESTSCGVYINDGSVTVSGKGSSLTATGGDVEGEYATSCGVWCQNSQSAASSVTVSDGAALSGEGGNVIGNFGCSYGVSCGEKYPGNEACSLTVSGGATLSGTSGDVTVEYFEIGERNGEYGESCGVCLRGDMRVNKGSKVSATAGKVSGEASSDVNCSVGILCGFYRHDENHEGFPEDLAVGEGAGLTASGGTYAIFAELTNAVEGKGSYDGKTWTPIPVQIYQGRSLPFINIKFLLKYDLWVGGTQAGEENTSGTGWSYDTEKNTLTLDGFTYSGAANAGIDPITRSAAIAWFGSEVLTIKLTGENAVTETATEAREGYGIYSETAGLVFTGGGSLRATGGNATEDNYGVYCGDGVTVSGDGTALTAAGGTDGVICNCGSVSIKSGANLTAAGGRYGVNCKKGSLTVESGAVLTASGNYSIDGSVKNADAGAACDKADGTGTWKTLPVNTDPGQKLSDYKRVEFIPLTLTLNANDGSGKTETLTTACHAETGSAADIFTRKGYVIAGWNTQANGKGTAYGAKPAVTKDNLTLYAQWKRTDPSVTITGVSDGKVGYTAENAPENAMLVAARYNSGKSTAVMTVNLNNAADKTGTVTLGGSGTEYKLMLVDKTSYVPLCPAAVSPQQN